MVEPTVANAADTADLYARYADLLELEHDKDRKDALRHILMQLSKELTDVLEEANEALEETLDAST